MLNKKTEQIIIKYFSKSASTSEMLELSDWVKEKSNDLIFKDYVKTNYLIDINMINFNTEKEKEKVFQKIKKNEKSVRINRFRKVFKYAAILIVTIGLGYLFNNKGNIFPKNEQNVISDTKVKIEPGTDKAILTLESGDEIALEKDKKIELEGRNTNGEELVYDTKSKPKNSSIQYNYLTIPRGGQFFVQLSDGTRVWLNSDTKLKFPVKFIEGETRQVELVYGEAYVSPSINHNGDAFKVKTRIQEIEVLGTEFNIKAYQDENDIITTLVEGKVAVGNGIVNKYLLPSQQSRMNIKDPNINIKKIDKVFDEIAWKDGYFSFKHKSMKDIMKILSRWYNIDYVFDNKEIENKSFTGVLDRENTINEILAYIQRTNEISFQITNNMVTIE